MATWKKVLVSGSNINVNQISGSSLNLAGGTDGHVLTVNAAGDVGFTTPGNIGSTSFKIQDNLALSSSIGGTDIDTTFNLGTDKLLFTSASNHGFSITVSEATANLVTASLVAPQDLQTTATPTFNGIIVGTGGVKKGGGDNESINFASNEINFQFDSNTNSKAVFDGTGFLFGNAADALSFVVRTVKTPNFLTIKATTGAASGSLLVGATATDVSTFDGNVNQFIVSGSSLLSGSVSSSLPTAGSTSHKLVLIDPASDGFTRDGLEVFEAQISGAFTQVSSSLSASIGVVAVDIANATSSIENISSSVGQITQSIINLTSSIVGTTNEISVTSTAPGNVTIGIADDLHVPGDLQVTGSTSISESLFVSGAITASDIHALGDVIIDGAFTLTGENLSQINVSTISGSTLFGSESSNTHRFTGSLFISGNDGVVINAGGLQVSGSINGSGSLFASLSIDNKDQIVVYDASTKQFFHTASSAIFNTSTDLTIGSPTDGDLDDGLLDFNSGSTTFTDAIDDINEVLAGLAPPAAPGLESIGAAGAAMGTTALLSFGQDNSNSITGVANVEDTPSILGNVDRNGSFVAEGSLTVSDSTPVSSSGVRLGVRGTTQIVSGALNITVGADGEPFINHSASAFNKGETGSLELYVNDTDTPKVTILLSESLAATSSLGSNGEKLSVTETASAHFPATGNSLSVFTHRTGSYFIPTAAQRDGLNYARVIHKHGDGTIKASNYYEWVNDIDGNSNHGTISITNVDLDVETKTGEKYLSGVKYFTSLSAEYRYEVNNFYNNVYPSTSQTWAEMQSQTSWFIGRLNLSGDGIATPTNNTGTGNTISAAAPALGNGAGKQDTKIHVTASITSSHGVSIVGDNADTGLAARIDSITHTYKNSISNANSQTAAGILLDNREDDSESTLNTIENFVSESFRLRSGSQTYSNQTAVSNVANRWNSSALIAGGGAATDHENSLLVLPAYNDSNTYNGSSGHGQLAYPDGGGSTSFVPNGGDFSGITTNAPSNTADYSGLSGVRTYLRKFKNNTGAPVPGATVNIGGGSTNPGIQGATIGLTTVGNESGNNISIRIKYPDPGVSGHTGTGFMDLGVGVPLAGDLGVDNVGCNSSTPVGAANSTSLFSNSFTVANGNASYGGNTIRNNDFFLVEIRTSAAFTAIIKGISVTF